MKDLIRRRDAINALYSAAEEWNIAEDYHEGVKAGFRCAARIVASLPPVGPNDVEIAYYKGMQDGIKKCTERLKRLNDEADDS